MVSNSATDILLINSAFKGDLHHMADYPYGMALIASYVRSQGYTASLVQYPHWEKETYRKHILDEPALLYGFQVSFTNYPDIRELIGYIKESNPSAKFVLGGPFVVSMYKQILSHDTNIDAAVLGEGEYTVIDLIEAIREGREDWKLTEGLAWRNEDGEIIMNRHRKGIADMNAMPFAARDGLEDGDRDLNNNFMYDVRITTSRGCTSDCTFCAVNVNSKWQRTSRWRGRDPLNVVDEIEELVEKYNVKMINLQDSAFDDPGTLGPKRNRIFCNEIIRRGIEISMKAYFRAESIKDDAETIDLFKLYKEAGIDVIIVGAEAGSDEELEIYGKDATLEDNYRAFKVLDELDVFFPHFGFLMFGPYTDLDMLRKNIKFIHKAGLGWQYRTIWSFLYPTPGAAIHDRLEKEGRLLPQENFWDIPSYQFDRPDVLKLVQHYHKLRDIYPSLDACPMLITAYNLISRLQNKMHRKIAVACKNEIEEFRKVFHTGRKKLNELSYLGFSEDLDRIEKDGVDADLMKNAEPYWGSVRDPLVNDIQKSYANMVKTIQDKGFGLAGLLFNMEHTKLEGDHNRMDEHTTVDDRNSDDREWDVDSERILTS
jgi:anaerobic magnesium-protoporphyrin IX monomethyl ester cyclase